MNINDMKSDLVMKNLFFKECSIKRQHVISNGDLNANLEKTITKIEDHTYNVELTLTINKEDLEILIIANAQFEHHTNDNNKNEEIIINTNTVAIMFPFIRSQVTLLTTQPGMTPIVLPAINTTKF